MEFHIYIYIYIYHMAVCRCRGSHMPQIIHTLRRGMRQSTELAVKKGRHPLGIHYRGVQWEGGAVDGSSTI